MSVSAILTRQELYDRVWQTPMVTIAAEYGISGRGLAKLCERHGIPVPGRGHWALTRAGYVMERDPLPPDPPPETKVSISGDPGKVKEEHPIVAAQIAYEKDHPIVVPAQLTRPHPLVAQAKSALSPRESGSDVATRGNLLPIRVSAKQIPRALRFFDAFFKACEGRGLKVKAKTVPHEAAIERSLIPDREEMGKIMRYSTHLTRLEEKAIAMLERLQTARREKEGRNR